MGYTETAKSRKQTPQGLFTEYEELAKRIAQLYNQPELADILLQVGDSGRKFFAHKAIIVATSEYLAELISASSEHDGKLLLVHVPDIEPGQFEMVLEFIYKATVPISSEAALLYHALAKRFRIEGLQLAAEKCITDSMSKDQVHAMLRSAHEMNAPYVAEQCMKYIRQNAGKVFRSTEIHHLTREDMQQLLNDQQLNANEIDIFRGLLQWAEHNKGTGEISEVMKEFLPLIRYGSIEAQDIRKHVLPTNLVCVFI